MFIFFPFSSRIDRCLSLRKSFVSALCFFSVVSSSICCCCRCYLWHMVTLSTLNVCECVFFLRIYLLLNRAQILMENNDKRLASLVDVSVRLAYLFAAQTDINEKKLNKQSDNMPVRLEFKLKLNHFFLFWFLFIFLLKCCRIL